MLSQQVSTLRFGGMRSHTVTSSSNYCHIMGTRPMFQGEQGWLKSTRLGGTKLQAVGNADESSFEQEVLKVCTLADAVLVMIRMHI
jgi:hypothetical protein